MLVLDQDQAEVVWQKPMGLLGVADVLYGPDAGNQHMHVVLCSDS